MYGLIIIKKNGNMPITMYLKTTSHSL